MTTLTLTSPAVIAAAKALQEHEGRCWPTDEQHQVFHQKRALAALQGAGVGELVDALTELIAAGDNSCDANTGDDADAMIRFATADKVARATLGKFTGA